MLQDGLAGTLDARRELVTAEHPAEDLVSCRIVQHGQHKQPHNHACQKRWRFIPGAAGQVPILQATCGTGRAPLDKLRGEPVTAQMDLSPSPSSATLRLL